MMKIKARKEQIKYTQDLLKIANFGQRGDGSKDYNNGNAEEQFVGILTQTMIADLLHQQRPKSNNGGDRGVDFMVYGIKIDVKSMGRHCDVKDFYIHNLHAEQTGKYYTSDVYIFCSLDKRDYTLTLCGWVTKEQFFQRAKFYPAGTIRTNPAGSFPVRGKGLYEIENRKLNQFDLIRQFRDAMFEIGKQKTK